MHRIEYILKHNKFIQRVYVIVFSLFFRVLGIFIKQDRKQVLFQSMIGKTFGDSPKVLYDAMRADERFKSFKYVWAFDDPDKFDVENGRKVKLNSLKYYIESLKSGIWISNVSIERGLKYKPKSVVYLNTWHGIPIKVIGNAQKTRNDYDYSDVDYMCCSSDFERKIFIRDFKIKNNAIIKCGMPRNDALYFVTDEMKKNIRKKYNIPENKKVILYAPTWRDSTDGGNSYQIAPPINIDYWKEQLGDEYILLFRMHHLTTELLGIEFNDFVRNVSNAPEINELMIISDILLSDYSATIFDYSILERPIFSFAYDLDSYAFNRGFYEDLEKDVLPNSVFKDEESLIKHIKNMDYSTECKKTRQIKRKYVDVSGNATKECMNFIISHIDG